MEDLHKLDRFYSGEEETTLLAELRQRGWGPKAIDELADDEVTRELTNLIWSLLDLQVYLEYTDHLSDRELYTLLWEYCEEPNICFAGIEGASTHWSPIGDWGEESCQIWLRFYATEDEREKHADEYPDDDIPPRESPKYPRPWIQQK